MAKAKKLVDALKRLEAASADWAEAAIQAIDQGRRNPFHVLVSTMLSLRTKDTTTIPASRRLLARAPDPDTMVRLDEKTIEKLIFPVGFYKTKAKSLLALCRRLIDEFGGAVPASLEGLLSFKGVGRKTANLVLSEGFLIPAICVDIHVHRISNRLGLLKTKTPLETEMALMELAPKKTWRTINHLLVRFGQNICLPVSPWCSRCPLAKGCPRNGVRRSR